ncbi:SRPBCC family protein [Gemmatimonas sp.]|uniref:SRPBCC family protein n=1 Tax=Gemmatimonas sp. TaxID=1962908 RepID=UPI00333F3E7D
MWIHDAHAESDLPPADLWARYVDVSRWTEWDPSLRRAALAGDFVVGAHGRLEALHGPPTAFTLTHVAAPARFDSRAVLPHVRVPLVRLDFEHRLTPTTTGKTHIMHRVCICGPLGWLAARLLGPVLAADADRAVRTLATTTAPELSRA